MTEGKAGQVVGFMQWIAPAGGLESVAAEPRVREVAKPEWASDEEVEHATEAVRRLETNEELAPEHVDALEAIILPQERPVVDVVNGTFDTPTAPFEHLGAGTARELIEAAIPSIGRIDLPAHPTLPYGGTGFVVGDGLLMTNRHVAALFSSGIGRDELTFTSGQAVAVDFLHERGRDEVRSFRVKNVVMVHPYWDMALLVTEGLEGVASLRLSIAEPGDQAERDVAVLGYPALDPRNDVELQNRIFRGVFSIKRLQPGKLRTRADVESFGHTVSAVTHDSSTLGGNSGSAVIDVETGMVVALHFAGRYLEANYAVPSRELALDSFVVDAGVNFEGPLSDGGPPSWARYWTAADPSDGSGERTAVSKVAADPPARTPTQQLSWSIPLELTVRLGPGDGAASVVGAPAASAAPTEALVEPFRDQDFSDRRGYDDQFLGVAVPVPDVRDASVLSQLEDGSHLLRYAHFSVAMNKERRLALFTASNVDATPARKRPEPGRDYSRRGLTGLGEHDQEKWFTDPRIPATHQLPDKFFTKDRASFDKGHIVRREDVAWGDSFDELRRANGDTYHVTNCSPQIASFNRSNLHGLWGELENMVLAQAKAERLCIFAGPVLRDDDPIFRGVDDDGTVRVPIPRQFWKVVVARGASGLQCFGFLLDQDLSDTDLEFAVDELWRTRMISLPDLEKLARVVAFPPELHAADQFGAPGGETLLGHPALGKFDG